jgi:GNAT superfamily N-acetyltransferase
MIYLRREGNSHAGFRELVRELDSDLRSRYGADQEQFTAYNQIETIHHVVVAFIDQVTAGCGCIRKFDADSVEIKRMYVTPAYRGSGMAAMIVRELESWALELGYERVILETGTKQPEAIRFYAKSGYEIIENFGPYVGDELSVCMAKII